MISTHRVRCPHCGTRQPFDLSGTDACAPAKCVNSKCRKPFWAYVRDGVFATAKEPIDDAGGPDELVQTHRPLAGLPGFRANM